MKSLLVILNGATSEHAVFTVAVAIAERNGFTVNAMTALDVGGTLYAETAAIRSLASSAKRVAGTLDLDQARERLKELSSSFEKQCDAAGVTFTAVNVEGEPYGLIRDEMLAHDLIVMCRKPAFVLPEDEAPSDRRAPSGWSAEEVLGPILHRASRPVIITPSTLSDGTDIIAAYDGSPPAGRALQLLALLGLASGKTVHVVTVQEDAAEAAAISSKAATYLRTHDIQVETHDFGSDDHPGDIILEQIKTLKPSMLAMGAYGHKGWREFLFGSSTSRLIQWANIPVFIHH